MSVTVTMPEVVVGIAIVVHRPAMSIVRRGVAGKVAGVESEVSEAGAVLVCALGLLAGLEVAMDSGKTRSWTSGLGRTNML
jgi:hypothetical protein